MIGPSWWQLAPAVVAGVIMAQLGFLAHDAAHRQVFASWRANEWGARLLSTLGIGLSYGWWTSKHNRHHRSPNQAGRDPDVAPGGLVFTAQAVQARPAGLSPDPPVGGGLRRVVTRECPCGAGGLDLSRV